MSNKEIEAWKEGLPKGNQIFVAAGVKSIHPVMDQIVNRLFEIDRIRYIRVTPSDIQASSDIATKGRTKIPISTPDHPAAIGIHLILNLSKRQFNSTKSPPPRRDMEEKS